MGPAVPEALRGSNDFLQTLLGFADEVAGDATYLLVGHSVGGYYAQAMAAQQPTRVAGLALVCPLLGGCPRRARAPGTVGSGETGDDGFRSYFVVQTSEMLERYERYVAPGTRLADWAALEPPETCSTTVLAPAWRSSMAPDTRCPTSGRNFCARW